MTKRNTNRTDATKTTRTITAVPNVEFDHFHFHRFVGNLLRVRKVELDEQRDKHCDR